MDGLEHRGPDVGQQWRIDRQTTLSSTFAEAARDVGLTPKRVQGAAGVLDALNVVIAGTTLMWNFKQGTLKPESGLEAAKFLSDSAGMAEMAAEAGKKTDDLPASVKRSMMVLAKLGPYLDAVTIAWNVASALSEDREEGLQKVDDPHYVGALGAMASGTGMLMLTGAFGTLGAPVLAGAGALTLLGAGLGWYEKLDNVEEQIASDPLGRKVIERPDSEAGTKTEFLVEQGTEEQDEKGKVWKGWLPEQSQWGKNYSEDTAAREALKKLATPTKAQTVGSSKTSGKSTRPRKGPGATPPVESLRDETEQFVQKAFTFPTAVGVPPKPDTPSASPRDSKPPLGLFLSVIPKYVPKARGTFMVDARVIPAAADTQATAVPLSFAVHYVQTPGGLRYCARSASTDPLTISSENTLKDVADDQNWAHAEPGATPTPDGEVKQKTHLPVHVGPVWKETWYSGAKQEEARSDVKNMEQLFRHRWDGDPPHWAEEEVKQAIEVGESVEPMSQIDASSELLSILQSGRFRVTGAVYFRPLQPFDPNPDIPSEESPALYARTDIGGQDGLTYPKDVQ